MSLTGGGWWQDRTVQLQSPIHCNVTAGQHHDPSQNGEQRKTTPAHSVWCTSPQRSFYWQLYYVSRGQVSPLCSGRVWWEGSTWKSKTSLILLQVRCNFNRLSQRKRLMTPYRPFLPLQQLLGHWPTSTTFDKRTEVSNRLNSCPSCASWHQIKGKRETSVQPSLNRKKPAWFSTRS